MAAHLASCCGRQRRWRWRRPRQATRVSPPPLRLQPNNHFQTFRPVKCSFSAFFRRTSALSVAEMPRRGRRAAGRQVSRLAAGRRIWDELVQRHRLQNSCGDKSHESNRFRRKSQSTNKITASLREKRDVKEQKRENS